MPIGSLFLLIKIYEWHIDISEHLFPAGPFKISGGDAGDAKMFWSFYFVATALHAAHMIVGVGLVGWIALQARRGTFAGAGDSRRSRRIDTGVLSISCGSSCTRSSI